MLLLLLQTFAQLSRVSEPALGPALCVALTPEHVISGWADGNIR